jgi:branched-chain amino acid aminotransferase
VRFRITVPAETPDRLILSIEPFRPYPAALYEVGVAVSLAHDTVRHSPEAKTTAWIHDRAAIEAALPEGAYTAVLVGNDGQLLEGVSSNFYAIVDGALRTAGADVLGGIAQQIVLLIAPDLIPVRREAITLGDLPRVQEAFITSASRGIMPVVRVIDPTHGITFGDGRPGERTRALRERYLAWASAHAETL